MTTDCTSIVELAAAANGWNADAEEFNQWDALGQDEKDELIAAEQERLASTDRVGVNPGNVE